MTASKDRAVVHRQKIYFPIIFVETYLGKLYVGDKVRTVNSFEDKDGTYLPEIKLVTQIWESGDKKEINLGFERKKPDGNHPGSCYDFYGGRTILSNDCLIEIFPRGKRLQEPDYSEI